MPYVGDTNIILVTSSIFGGLVHQFGGVGEWFVFYQQLSCGGVATRRKAFSVSAWPHPLWWALGHQMKREHAKQTSS